MELDFSSFERLIGERKIVRILGKSLPSSSASVYFEVIVIELDNSSIVFSVDNESDEICIHIVHKNIDNDIAGYIVIDSLSQYSGSELGWIWSGVNYRGYTDMAILSFSGINPNVIFYCVGSSLEILHVNKRPIRN